MRVEQRPHLPASFVRLCSAPRYTSKAVSNPGLYTASARLRWPRPPQVLCCWRVILVQRGRVPSHTRVETAWTRPLTGTTPLSSLDSRVPTEYSKVYSRARRPAPAESARATRAAGGPCDLRVSFSNVARGSRAFSPLLKFYN